MELRKTLTGTMVAVASLVALTAAPQSPPITSDTGRFGDATSIARKYQDYIYGVIKEKKPDELILTKTKFGVDQSIKLTKKTKFTVDGKPSLLEKLQVGEGIYIDVDKGKKAGDLIAKKVIGGADVPSIPSVTP
ncbi:MAG: hypothetical protein ACLQVL_35730 [Terriglobia bacterium]